MSRLIDSDKLPYEDIECTDGRTYMVVNAYDVENASTVKAIPISKIKRVIEEIQEKAFTEEIFYEDYEITELGWVSDEITECGYVETEIVKMSDVLAILNKLLAESEDK